MSNAHIEALTEEVDRITRELAIAKSKLVAAKIAAAGVSIGQEVMYNGIRYKVTNIDVSMFKKPWLKGVSRTKSGEWGKQNRHLYGDWELIAGKAA